MRRSIVVGIVMIAYCVVPMRLAAQAGALNSSNINGRGGADAEAKIKEMAAKPTPRGPDGHPDLNGYWDYIQYDKESHLDANGNFYINVPNTGGGTPRGDTTLADQLRPPTDPNPPPYKPELLAKVHQLALDEVHNDPAFHCKPLGVPRAGAPRQIVQTPKLALFLYQIDAGIGDQPGSYRLVPTDGRPHRTDVDPSYFGDSVGHWEGDTLVVDVTHLNDETWLAGGDGGSGYFHSDAVHVVERFTRKGDTLRWEATVEDPKVLTKAWIVTPQTEILSNNMVYEQPICEERETQHIIDKY